MDISAAIQAVEAACGASVCFHDFDGSLAPLVGERLIRHQHPVCRRAKERASARCLECDLHACQAHLERDEGGFWKVCHAGLLEAYVPVRDGGRNLGALFLGPWRWSGHDAPAGLLIQPGPRLPGNPAALTAAPDAGLRARHLALARLLAAAVARAAVAAPAVSMDRPTRILRLVDEHLHGPYALRDLARALGLSASRCGHLVRAEFAMTFPALVEQRRLAQASRQLIATTDTVTRVAQRCGFASTSYFVRRFRLAHDQTPEAFRRLARQRNPDTV